MNNYSIFKISKMIPPSPPQADYDIYGMLKLSQFIDEIEKIVKSRVIHVVKFNLKQLTFLCLSLRDI